MAVTNSEEQQVLSGILDELRTSKRAPAEGAA